MTMTPTRRAATLSTKFATAAALAFMLGALAPQAAAAEERPEYCISGPESKLVTLRDGPSAETEEAGLGRGGDCGMEVAKCEGDWCLMQMSEFEAWIEKKDIRLK